MGYEDNGFLEFHYFREAVCDDAVDEGVSLLINGGTFEELFSLGDYTDEEEREIRKRVNRRLSELGYDPDDM